jgi:triosephosphate isomerase
MRSIFCVGEKLDERDGGNTFSVIASQCAALFSLQTKALDGFIFAYEPVWAIGTGRTATSAQAEEVHAFLRKEIGKHWGAEAAAKTQILYGGSVKTENSQELMACANVDGVLVGGASLDAAAFLAIAGS